MRKIILFLLLPFYLFAFSNDIFVFNSDGSFRSTFRFCCYGTSDKNQNYSILSNKHLDLAYLIDGKFYSMNGVSPQSYSIQCEKDFTQVVTVHVYVSATSYYDRNSYPETYLIADALDYCKNKIGYVYDSSTHSWFNPDSGDHLCPDGQIWSSAQEKCIDDFNTQRDKCYQKCGGEEFTKSFTVDSNGSSICVCKLCSDIYNDYVQYCNAQGGNLKDFSCQDDGEKITSLSPRTQSPDICSIPDDNNQSDVNNSDSNMSDDSNVSDSGSQNNSSNSQESTDDGSNNQNNTDGSNGSSGSGSNESNSSNNVDCCSYYKSGHGQWTSVNGCLEYTIPETGQKCRIKDDGLKCYECNSGSSSGSNSSGSINDIVTEINQTNSRLDKINNTLNDIIDLKPDSNISVRGSLSPEESSFISDYSNFLSNVVSDFDSLKGSYNDLESMLNSGTFSLTLFDSSDSISCPITTHIYKSDITFDICKFVYPYKPILQLFFTLFFNFSVVSFFVRLILKRSEK